jgi:DNA polymerase III sliding clamp (beta) subunit (PCNA family)
MTALEKTDVYPKITVDAKCLGDAIRFAKQAMEKTPKPTLASMVKLETEKGYLVVSGFGEGICIQSKISLQSAGPFGICVDGEMTARLLSVMHGPAIIEAKGSRTSLRVGRFDSTLVSSPTEDYRRPLERKKVTESSVTALTLHSALSCLRHALPRNEERPELCGVYLSTAPKTVLIATDGVRMFSYKLGSPLNELKLSGGVIPTKAVLAILEMLKDVDGEEEIKCSIGWEGLTAIYFSVEQGDRSITVSFLDAIYPNLSSIFEKEYPHKAKFSKSELISTIDLALIAATDQAHRTVFRIDQKSLAVHVDHDPIDMNTSISAAEGKELEIAINGKFLKQAAEQLPGAELVLEYDNALSMVRLRSEGVDDVFALIMPMKPDPPKMPESTVEEL